MEEIKNDSSSNAGQVRAVSTGSETRSSIVGNMVDSAQIAFYRVGGVYMLSCGALVLVANVLLYLGGPLPSGGEALLQYLEGRAVPAQVTAWLFGLYDLLLVPVILALYLALKGANRNTMLVAVGFIGLYIALDLAITESNFLTPGCFKPKLRSGYKQY